MADPQQQRQQVIRSALLTTGVGPIAKSAYAAVTKHTELRGVVFSRNNDVAPRWQKLGKYGYWYALQYLLSRAWFVVTGSRSIGKALPAGLPTRVWEHRREQDETAAWVRALGVDLIVVCGLQYILKRPFIETFKYVVNIHPALLPDYRGPEPIIWGLLDRVSTFGVSLHLVDEGIDTGDVLYQKGARKPFLPLEAAVESSLARLVPEGIKCVVQRAQEGDLRGVRQGEGFYLSLPTLANRKVRGAESELARVSPLGANQE